MKTFVKGLSRVTAPLRLSLVARLTFFVVVFVGVLFVGVLTVFSFKSRHAVKEEAIDLAMQNLDKTVQTIDNILQRVEIASANMLWLVEHHLDSPDSMFEYSRQLLQNNPELYGCSISFEPYYYKSKGRYFSVYSCRDDSITTEQEGSDSYQYFTLDWYRAPKEKGSACWVEPYSENESNKMIVADAVTSYCLPIHDSEGHIVGVLSVDVPIDSLSAKVVATKPYPHSFNTMLSKQGTYIVHPDTSKLLRKNALTVVAQDNDPDVTALVKDMLDGKSDYRNCTLDGQSSYVFFKPFKNTGWSVAIVCPESDIFSNYSRMLLNSLMMAIVGLLLLLIATRLFIYWRFQPFDMLTKSAIRVANGDFSNPITASTSHDEVGQLQNSFLRMQHSLADYVEKARLSRDNLQQRNRELAAAYERAKEEEKVKTAFLNNMTDQLVEPVGVIAHITTDIKTHYSELSEGEMNGLVEQMQEKADTVADLLNQMIEIALKESTTTKAITNTENA